MLESPHDYYNAKIEHLQRALLLNESTEVQTLGAKTREHANAHVKTSSKYTENSEGYTGPVTEKARCTTLFLAPS